MDMYIGNYFGVSLSSEEQCVKVLSELFGYRKYSHTESQLTLVLPSVMVSGELPISLIVLAYWFFMIVLNYCRGRG